MTSTVVRTRHTARQRLEAALFYGIVIGLAWLTYSIFQPVLAPLAWASILVVLFHPLQARLERRLGSTAAASISTLLVMLILVVPSILLLASFVREGLGAASNVQQTLSGAQFVWVNRAWTWLTLRIPGIGNANFPLMVQQQGEKLAGGLAAHLGGLLRDAFNFFFGLLVMVVALFYIFRDTRQLMTALREVLPFSESQRERMIAEAGELIHASVTFSLLSAVAQGIAGGAIFALAGIPQALFWGVAMGFFSLLPLVGSSIIWLPAAAFLMFHGHVGKGIIVIIACVGIVNLLDNVLRPWLISGRAELSGLVIFISILGGLKVFGLLGLILGPVVLASTTSVLDIYRTRTSGSRASPPSSHAVLQ
jgi:predicted PurR-regulated permease PerM